MTFVSVERPYGVFLLGDNNVVFVAPHGGDPLETPLSHGLLELSRSGSGVIINDRLRRSEVDLNSSAQIANRKDPAGLAFFDDVVSAVERALRLADGECFVFFVHNAPKQFNGKSKTFPRVAESEERDFDAGASRPYQLDIGAGVTWVKPKYEGLSTGDLFDAMDENDRAHSLESWIRPAREVWPDRGTGGVPTFSRDQLLYLVYLAKEMKLPWRVEIGREFAA